MCRIYYFVKTCPHHLDGPALWVADWELTAQSPRCSCRLVRRRQWGTCPNFDSHFAKPFKNDRDVRVMHCDECLKYIVGCLTLFLKNDGWSKGYREGTQCSTSGDGLTPSDSSDELALSVVSGRRTV